MPKHTQGPWKFFQVGKVIEVQASNAEQPPIVHWMGFDDCFRSLEEHEANARLIAAAPELLEALESIIELGKRDLSNEKYDGYFETARAAIAKAKGGT